LIATLYYETKTLSSYSMPMVPDKIGYACDWYHSLGIYYAVEDDLFIDKNKKAVADFLFPRLHSQRDDIITRNLTKTIRDYLPVEVPDKLRKSYPSKSLRKGGMTELALHRDIGFSKSVA